VAASEEEQGNVNEEKTEEEVEDLRTVLEAKLEEVSRIRFRGESRFRLRDVRSIRTLPMGSYGETLQKGRTFNHRMILEIEADVSRAIIAGGMFRLSDEGKLAFEVGPERLSDERGSAFVRYETGNVRIRFGYYRVHLTPLVLMRWDLEDNPEGGGETRCACPGAGGSITGEGLEEMGRDLTFEGIKVDTDVGERLEWTGLLARPQIALEEHSYRQYTYGTNLRVLSYHKPSTSFRSLSIALFSHRDDETSVDRPVAIPYRPVQNRILDVHLNFPVTADIRFKAECALTHTEGNLLSKAAPVQRGHAALVEAHVRHPSGMWTKIAYLRMSPEYRSLYSAVSYIPNRQGFRISANWEFAKDRLSVWAFYKRMRQIESRSEGLLEFLLEDVRLTFSTLSFGIIVTPPKDMLIRAVVLLHRDRADERWPDTGRRTVIAEVTRHLSHTADVSFTYQRTDYQDRANPAFDYSTHIPSLLASVTF